MINTNIDNLIEKTSSLIENLDKHIPRLVNQPISMVDFFTLIAAILAVIISGVSIYVTFRCDKKNRESNERIAEAAIDANLTANARIEWIQNVRQATAELITACYKYMGSTLEERQINWDTMQEKKALYVLYFGPDNDGSKETLANDLLDKKTNKGKNDRLVSFVNNIYSGISQYHQIQSDLEYYNKSIKECNGCLSYDEENNEFIKEYKCSKSEYDIPFDDEDCTKVKNQLNDSIQTCNVFVQDISTNLQKLSEIMRIYGKIEWNRAKGGK